MITLKCLCHNLVAVSFSGDWHFECITGQLSDLQSLNLTLGHVKQLNLLACGNKGPIPYADLLRSLSVQGLEELRIDMGENSHSKPLKTQSFMGLHKLYPGIHVTPLPLFLEFPFHRTLINWHVEYFNIKSPYLTGLNKKRAMKL